MWSVGVECGVLYGDGGVRECSVGMNNKQSKRERQREREEREREERERNKKTDGTPVTKRYETED